MRHARFLSAGILISICGFLQAKELPPCAAQVKCEITSDHARCSPELSTPQVCAVGTVEVVIVWEAVRPPPDTSPHLESKTVLMESKRWSRLPGFAPPPAFEQVLAPPAEYRVRLIVHDAGTGKLLSSASAYFVRDGDRYAIVPDHPAILSRPVPIHHVQFDGALRW